MNLADIGLFAVILILSTISCGLMFLKCVIFKRKKDFPPSAKEISNTFLTYALQKCGEIPNHVRIEKIETESLKGGVHFKVVKAILQYNVENIDSIYPESVVVKMIDSHHEMTFLTQLLIWLQVQYPKLNFGEKTSELYNKLQGYTIEVQFYNNFSEKVKIPTPSCYYNYEDYYNVQYLMIMEDLSAYHNGEPLGFNIHNSKTLLKNIAKLHGEYWNTGSSSRGDIWKQGGYWLGNKEMQFSLSLSECFDAARDNFKDIFNNLNNIEELKLNLIEYEDKVHHIVHSQKPKTIIHGDYKISNLFVNEKKDKAFTIDWQWMGGGSCSADVAYFIYTSVRIDDQNMKDHSNQDDVIGHTEMELLKTYYENLIHFGVTDYPFELFKEQYIFNVIYFFLFCVREKWSEMSQEMFFKYKKSNIDGLHLRSSAHIKRLFDKSAEFMKYVIKKYAL